MNAAIANVPAVIAVPTEVAGVSRSCVMPAIDTVSALTANEAWICVRTTTMRGSHDVRGVAAGADIATLSPGASAPSTVSLAEHGTILHTRSGAIAGHAACRLATLAPVTDSGVTLLILTLAVIAFISGRVPTGIVAIGVSLALLATGIIDLPQAFAGFADPAVILIAALFVVAEGLDSSGLTSWTGQQLVRRGGSPRALTALVMLVVGILSALISVNGAVAALLPVVVVIAARSAITPSRLLLPLAFGAHSGALLTLTGSPVNVLASEFAAEAGGGPFGFFSFAIAGIPLVIGSIVIVVFFGHRLVPERTPATLPARPQRAGRCPAPRLSEHRGRRRSRHRGGGRRRRGDGASPIGIHRRARVPRHADRQWRLGDPRYQTRRRGAGRRRVIARGRPPPAARTVGRTRDPAARPGSGGGGRPRCGPQAGRPSGMAGLDGSRHPGRHGDRAGDRNRAACRRRSRRRGLPWSSLASCRWSGPTAPSRGPPCCS